MQHRYVGDVGDFGKYGLLRAIMQGQRGRVGVAWYLAEPEKHNKDGKHEGYLTAGSAREREGYRCCDPLLYDELQLIRRQQQLSVEMVQTGRVLPEGTIFYGCPVPAWQGRVGREGQQERWQRRDAWHEQGLQTLQAADLVFTDPDNGIIFSKRREIETRKPSHKHSFWHELLAYLTAGKSLVAYHHLGRQKGGHVEETGRCLRLVAERGYRSWAVHYRRGTARAFIIIPAKAEHRPWLWQATKRFTSSPWKAHASLIELQTGASVETGVHEG